MAGFVSGFNTGWGIMNDKIQQDKADQRYEERKATEQDRYDTNLGFRQAQEERNAQTFQNSQENYEYNKGLRPLQEEASRLGIQSAKNSNTIQSQTIAANQKATQLKNINQWGDRLHEQLQSGTLTPETFQGFQEASKGTAFNLDNIVDPQYQQSLDYLSEVIKDPAVAGQDPQALAAFNRVFQDQINNGKMVGNGVRKEITGVKTKGGKLTFDVTTYDVQGNPIRTAPLTTGRSPDDSDGNQVLVDFGDLVDQVQARKMIAATYLSNPRLRSEVQRVHNQLHPVDAATLKARNQLAPRSQQLQKLFVNAQKQRDAIYKGVGTPDPTSGVLMPNDKQLSAREQADLDYKRTLAELGNTYSRAEFQAAGIPYAENAPAGIQQPQKGEVMTGEEAGQALMNKIIRT